MGLAEYKIERKTKMNRVIIMAVAAIALVGALTGCCMFGKKDCCCKSDCEKTACECKSTNAGHGANASMSVGVGTHGVTGDMGASMH